MRVFVPSRGIRFLIMKVTNEKYMPEYVFVPSRGIRFLIRVKEIVAVPVFVFVPSRGIRFLIIVTPDKDEVLLSCFRPLSGYSFSN